MRHLHVYSGCIAMGLIATGCALHEVQHAPPTLPGAFAAPPVAAEGSLPEKNWYDDFGSPELHALIGQAAANNLDLGMARARVTQADARARQAGESTHGRAPVMWGPSREDHGVELGTERREHYVELRLARGRGGDGEIAAVLCENRRKAVVGFQDALEEDDVARTEDHTAVHHAFPDARRSRISAHPVATLLAYLRPARRYGLS